MKRQLCADKDHVVAASAMASYCFFPDIKPNLLLSKAAEAGA